MVRWAYSDIIYKVQFTVDTEYVPADALNSHYTGGHWWIMLQWNNPEHGSDVKQIFVTDEGFHRVARPWPVIRQEIGYRCGVAIILANPDEEPVSLGHWRVSIEWENGKAHYLRPIGLGQLLDPIIPNNDPRRRYVYPSQERSATMSNSEVAELKSVGYEVYSAEDGNLSPPGLTYVEQGLSTLMRAVSKTTHAHGWWTDDDGNRQDRNMGEMIALMHSELSEAIECHRNSEPDLWYDFGDGERWAIGRNDEGVQGKPCGIATEFADVIIRILDTCETLGIPLIEALLQKHAYNITRPYRHGGKAC